MIIYLSYHFKFISLLLRSAGMQTMKGLFTAGIVKSSVYAWNKVSKRFSLPSLSYS
jgi:hypothetical protein